MSQEPTQPAPAARPRRRRRLMRHGVTALIVLGLVTGIGAWVVTRSWFITAQLEPALERLLGGDVTIGSAEYHGSGRFMFFDVVLHARQHPGPSGEVCRIGRTDLVLDMDELFAGEIALRSVKLRDVRVRLSEDATVPGYFTFMGLNASRVGPKATLPPEIRIDDATVEVGVHNGLEYEKRGQRVFAGNMRPTVTDDGRPGWYRLTLLETGAAADEDTDNVFDDEVDVEIDGKWNARSNAHEFHISEVRLDDRVYDMCPKIVRLWWDRMDLQGHLSEVDFGWTPTEGFRARLAVEDVELTLPIDTEEMWARYRAGAIEESQGRPRMQVNSGTIELTQDSARLIDLEGELRSTEGGDMVGVPYEVSVEIDELPAIDWDDRERWLDEALDHAAFHMEFRADEFRVRRDEKDEVPAVELPLPVARVLEKFRFSDWVLSTAVAVWRDPPERAPDGSPITQRIESRGQAYITDGSGTYEKFQYPLRNVEAYLEFDTDKVTVHYVTGDGSSGAKVRISGTIAPPTQDAEVALQLTATGVPFDGELRGALHPDHQSIFDALLHHDSYRALREAGRLPTEATLEAFRHEVTVLETVLAEARQRADAAESERAEYAAKHVARLESDIGRRRAIIEAGLFAPGGSVDLDLQLARAAGPDQPTLTTGAMRFESFGLVYERFPYPLHVSSGRLEWRQDRVVLVGQGARGGLPVVTAGGGRGELRGEIVVQQRDGNVRAVPDLELEVRADEVSDVLYASMPLTAAERDDPDLTGAWPGRVLSRGGRLLRDLDLTGLLDYVADIGTDDEGSIDFDVALELREGRAVPAAALRELVSGVGSFDPDEWQLMDCAGTLRVSRDTIELGDLTGRVGRGRLALRGNVDLRSDPLDLFVEAEITEMEFGESLLGVVPAEHRARADELWERYRPQGLFDAHLKYRAHGGQTEMLDLTVRPRSMTVLLDDREVTLTRADEEGAVRIESDRVRFENLRLGVREAGRSDGTIELNGAIGMTSKIAPEGIRGEWMGGHLESPIVAEGIDLAAAGGHATRWREWSPRGSFDGSFRFVPGGDGPADYEITVTPSDLAFQLRGEELAMDLEPGGTFLMTPGWITLENVRCRRDEEVLDLSGEIELGGPLRLTLRLGFHGLLRGGHFEGVLPGVVQRALAAIELEEGQSTRLTGGLLSVLDVPAAHGEPGRHVEFTGRLLADDASIRTGVLITEIDGPIDIHVATGPDTLPRTVVRAQPHSANLLGQQVEAINVHVVIEGSEAVLREFRADARHGVISAEARAGVGQGKPYRFTAQFVGVPVSDFRVASPESDGKPAKPREDKGGRLYARFDLAGDRGDRASRTGRGVARVIGGPLTEVPLMLQVLQLFHLAVPGQWEYADAEFFIAGDRLVFEDLLFEATIMNNIGQQLRGGGELDLATWDLDARLNTRGGLFLIRDVVGAVGDQLGTIHVTGTLWEPVPSLVPLPGLMGPKALAGTAPRIRRREEASP
ncbi:MAG: hypothetical protein GY715_00555 [Planctomycetes bacterium]|nr:hypothetical protein [Planctomycetota bacterium]